jgi:16S rRNA (guanine527-N7)-methyltransferase
MPHDPNQLLLDVSRETVQKLRLYDELLHKWQKAINIISPTTLVDSWNRHFLDSAQISPLMPENVVLADLGCGGGFPGLVLALLKPELEVHLIESDEKKCQFMRTVSRETQTAAHIHTQRVEASYDIVLPDVITARALASLEKLLDYTWPWIMRKPTIKCIFMKGERADEEIEIALKRYNFDYELIPSKTDAKARIIVLTNIMAL